MPLPPDRSTVRTEHRHAGSHGFDALETADAVKLLADDHRGVAEAVADRGAAIAAFLDDLVPRMRGGGRLVYVGAGTSGRLGVLDAAECPPTFHADAGRVVGVIAGGDASLRRSSEGMEDDENGAAAALRELALCDRDTVLGIAAGATTPYVIGALRLAREASAMTAFLTCSAPAPDRPVCDHLLFVDTGPELLTGSTRLKAGSATKLVLNTITTIAFTKLGHVYSNLMVDLRATNDKLHDRAIRILRELCPELSRAESAALLERAGRRLKPAIVMGRLDVDHAEAEALLAEHGGRLRGALDEKPVTEDR